MHNAESKHTLSNSRAARSSTSLQQQRRLHAGACAAAKHQLRHVYHQQQQY